MPPRFIVLLACLGLSAQAAQWTICTDHNSSPPNHIVEGAKVTGTWVESLQNAAVAHDIDLHIEPMPFKRCLALSEQGVYGGVLAAAYKQDRSEFLRYPPGAESDAPHYAIAQPTYVLWVRKSSDIFWDGTGFVGQISSFSSPNGWFLNSFLQELGIKVVSNVEVHIALDLVANGRLSGYLVEQNLGEYLLGRSDAADELRAIAIPELSTPWYLVFNNGFYQEHAKQIDMLWQQMAQ